MNGNLMDTNVIVRVLNGDRELINELSKISSLCTCTVVLGELMYGAAKSAHVVQNKQNAKSFCSRYPLLGVSNIVAEFYGEIKKDLLSHGNVMPENDMWIAATALANDMTVITQDKHFEHIQNLMVIKL
ncbi:MAG: PIN domain-containing protein [Treponema sp.]|jgi:tRNA(fMet)-specific endonuclease VapC|nr:PIN domain-containing protein [Treponema sp.]